MKPMTYTQIIDLMKDIEHRSIKEMTIDEYKMISQSCRWDEMLSIYLTSYPPINFMKYYRRARDHFLLNEPDQELRDGVHDPIYDKSRAQSFIWLEKILKDSVRFSNFEECAEQYRLSFNEEVISRFVEKHYEQQSSSKKEEIKADFYLFIHDYLKYYYQHNESANQNISKILSYLEKINATPILKENFIEILMSAFDEARKAYEGKEFKYISPFNEFAHDQYRDWSCYPGANERVLDSIGAYALSIDPLLQEAQQKLSPFYEYVDIVCKSMLKKEENGSVPSALLNSLILEAALPRGYEALKIRKEHYHLVPERSKKLEDYADRYAEEQFLQKKRLLERIAEIVLNNHTPSLKEFLELAFSDPEEFKAKTTRLKPEDLSGLILVSPNQSIQKSLKQYLTQQGLSSLIGIPDEQITKLIQQHFYQQDHFRFMTMLSKDFNSEAEAALYRAHLNLSIDFEIKSFFKEEVILLNTQGEQVSLSSLKTDKEMLMTSLNRRLSERWVSLLNSINSRLDTDLLDVFQSTIETSTIDLLVDASGKLNPELTEENLNAIKQKALGFLKKEIYWNDLKYVDYVYWDESFKARFSAFLKSKINRKIVYTYNLDFLMSEGFYAPDELLSESLDFDDELFFKEGQITLAGSYILAFIYSHSCEKTFYKILDFLISKQDPTLFNSLFNIILKSSPFPVDEIQINMLRHFISISRSIDGFEFSKKLFELEDKLIQKSIIKKDQNMLNLLKELNEEYFFDRLQEYFYLENGLELVLKELPHFNLKTKIQEMSDQLWDGFTSEEAAGKEYFATLFKIKTIIPQLSKSFLDQYTSLDEGPFKYIISYSSCYESDNDFETLRLLIAQGQNLNVHDQDGKTILMHLVEAAKEDPEDDNLISLIELLIEHGANMNEKDLSGESALTLVQAAGQEILFTKINEKLQSRGQQILFSRSMNDLPEDGNELANSKI